MDTRSSFATLSCALLLGAVLIHAAEADAQSAPKRKSGLWQQSITSTMAQLPPTSMTMCTDEKTDDLMTSRASNTQQCTQPVTRKEGNAYVFEAVCKDGASTVKARGTFTGDFATHYTGELRYTFDPPQRGMKEMVQKIDARWLGPCKPGQKPGDLFVEGVGGMNVNQMMGGDPQKMQEMMNDPKKMQQMQEMMEKMKQMQQQAPRGKP